MVEDKKYFFMAGLPRSGSTLLASILNQNPDIYVSAQSPLPNMLGAAYNQYQSKENLDSSRFDDIYNVVDNVIPLFYEKHPEKYIIDKNFSWLEPHPYVILEHHLKNDIKVICPVRNVLEILASWNRLCENDKNSEYDKIIRQNDNTNRKMPDRRADFFMNANSEEQKGIVNGIENMKRILYPQFKDQIMLVEYDDLVNDTENMISGIYDFLGIEKYQHDFSLITNPHEYKDIWGVKNHHTIKSKISKEDYDFESIFSADTIKKYSGLEFWKDIK
jgi:sulfotransferase